MAATKEQERAALAQIREIVAGLGEDSYVGKAFEGCFEIAEGNIDNDFMNSMQQRVTIANSMFTNEREKSELFRDTIARIGKERDQLADEVDRLKAQIERGEEWKPYHFPNNVSQTEYDKLSADSEARELSDDEAAQIIADEFGFDRDKIEIVREHNIYERNRHGRLRKVGTTPRRPLFDVWDWYYICFIVKGHSRSCWEVYNGVLTQCNN